MSDTLKKTIVYYLVAKNIIKFADDNSTYPIAEGVIVPTIRKGDMVDVTITDGKITSISKDVATPTAIAPAPEPKIENTAKVAEEAKKSASVLPFKELTVFAIMVDKRLVKFVEMMEAGWLDVSPEVQKLDYKEYGFVAKSKIKVSIVDNTVVAIEKVAQTAPQSSQDAPSEAKPAKTDNHPATVATTPGSKEFVPKNEKDAFYYCKELERKVRYLEDNKQDSIEVQSAVNAACDVAGRIAAAVSPMPTAEFVNTMIKMIAKANYELLQELKPKR